MKADFCKDCVYYETPKKNYYGKCKKSFCSDIRSIINCPMNYTEKDLEWRDEKEKEDSLRGYILYSIVKEVEM